MKSKKMRKRRGHEFVTLGAASLGTAGIIMTTVVACSTTGESIDATEWLTPRHVIVFKNQDANTFSVQLSSEAKNLPGVTFLYSVDGATPTTFPTDIPLEFPSALIDGVSVQMQSTSPITNGEARFDIVADNRALVDAATYLRTENISITGVDGNTVVEFIDTPLLPQGITVQAYINGGDVAHDLNDLSNLHNGDVVTFSLVVDEALYLLTNNIDLSVVVPQLEVSNVELTPESLVGIDDAFLRGAVVYDVQNNVFINFTTIPVIPGTEWRFSFGKDLKASKWVTDVSSLTLPMQDSNSPSPLHARLFATEIDGQKMTLPPTSESGLQEFYEVPVQYPDAIDATQYLQPHNFAFFSPSATQKTIAYVGSLALPENVQFAVHAVATQGVGTPLATFAVDSLTLETSFLPESNYIITMQVTGNGFLGTGIPTSRFAQIAEQTFVDTAPLKARLETLEISSAGIIRTTTNPQETTILPDALPGTHFEFSVNGGELTPNFTSLVIAPDDRLVIKLVNDDNSQVLSQAVEITKTIVAEPVVEVDASDVFSAVNEQITTGKFLSYDNGNLFFNAPAPTGTYWAYRIIGGTVSNAFEKLVVTDTPTMYYAPLLDSQGLAAAIELTLLPSEPNHVVVGRSINLLAPPTASSFTLNASAIREALNNVVIYENGTYSGLPTAPSGTYWLYHLSDTELFSDFGKDWVTNVTNRIANQTLSIRNTKVSLMLWPIHDANDIPTKVNKSIGDDTYVEITVTLQT